MKVIRESANFIREDNGKQVSSGKKIKLKKENGYFSVFILVIIVEIIATLWFYRV